MLTKLWIWFKSLWHVCGNFRSEIGYGLTPYGLGRYEYQVCRECGKERVDSSGHTRLYDFTKDKELYK